MIPDTRAHAGNRSIDILTDEEKPGHLRFSMVWIERDHWEKFRAWCTEQGTLDLGDADRQVLNST